MLDYLGKQEIYKDLLRWHRAGLPRQAGDLQGHRSPEGRDGGCRYPKEEMEVVDNDILQGDKRKERRVSNIERFLTF